MKDDSSTVSTLLSQGGITFFGNLLSRLTGFVFLLVVTRFTNPNVYGTYVLALSIVSITQKVSSIGIDRSVDYFLPQQLSNEAYPDAKGVLINALVVGVVAGSIGALVLLVSAPFVGALFDNNRLAFILPLLVAMVPLGIIHSILSRLFSSVKMIRYRVFMKDVVKSAAKLGLSTILLLAGFGLVGLVVGHIFAVLIAVAFGIIVSLKYIPWVRGAMSNSVSRRSMLSYSTPLLFSGLISAFVAQIDFIVLGYFLRADDVGVYRIGYRLSQNLLIVLMAITPIFKVMISEEQEDTDEIRFRYHLATRWIVMLTVPMALTLALAPELYLQILFTSEFSVAGGVVTILTAGYLFNAIVGPEGKVLQGLGYTRLTFVNTILLLGVNFGLDLALIPRIGVVGAAIGTATGIGVASIAGVLELYYLRGLHPFSGNLARIAISGIPPAAFGAGYLNMIRTPLLEFVGLPIVVSVTYLVILVAVTAFNDQDREAAATIDERLGYKVFSPIVSFR